MKKYIKPALTIMAWIASVYFDSAALAIIGCAFLFYEESQKQEETPKPKKHKPIEYGPDYERHKTILNNIDSYKGNSEGQQKVR